MSELTRHTKQRKRIVVILVCYISATLLHALVIGLTFFFTENPYESPAIMLGILALIINLIYCFCKTCMVRSALREYDRVKDIELLDDVYRENVFDKGNRFYGNSAVSNRVAWIVIGIFCLFAAGMIILVLMLLPD
jgi:type IV secretory pathway component VirB8